MNVGSRFKRAWNAFLNRDPTAQFQYIGSGYSYRPDRPRVFLNNDKNIVVAIENRIAMDTAAIQIEHTKLDENGRLESVVEDGLNNCLTLEANIDQSSRAFIQDIVMSMLDEGCVAVVPVDIDDECQDQVSSYSILTMRTGKIIQWYPEHVRVRLYNDRTGEREEITLPKSYCAIIENPMYAVMNEPNSTMQRLIRKMRLLDIVDEQASSGKMDLIIQLPYVIKTEAKKKQAEERRKMIEVQLTDSKYGIAYIDSTEHVTQLNRSIDNNLLEQVEYLTKMLYSQLGITEEIMNGTADEQAMLNYYSRTIEPIMAAIADEFKRKFLTKTARSQRHSIEFYRDPFSLVPVNNIADIADKFTRNEIMSPNEIRQVIGMKPSDDEKADELRNRNISQSNEEIEMKNGSSETDIKNSEEGGKIQNG